MYGRLYKKKQESRKHILIPKKQMFKECMKQISIAILKMLKGAQAWEV